MVLDDIIRRLIAVGVTLFFAALIFFLVTFIVQNPHIISSVIAAIEGMIRSVFSLASG